VAVGGGLLAAAGAAAGAPVPPPEEVCAAETARSEQLYGIPATLLATISIVESGRYDRDRKAVIAWPWTVMAEGQGRYFPTKAEAVAEVRKLRARGVRNIDVGCMQVNLSYHPDAFPSLDDAFDPATNVAYAARFLKGLYGATQHWPTAASYYHSQTPSLANAYRERLVKAWNANFGSGGTALAAAKPPPSKLAVPTAPSLKPIPSAPGIDEKRKSWREQQAADRIEAQQIASAYRAARMAEYQLRRARFEAGR
jgi:hypothetical protein